MRRQKKTFHAGSASGACPRSLRCLPQVLVLATALFALAPAAALAAGSALTKPATKVHHTNTVLNGHLDPEGDPGIVECHFEWGETVAYGNTAPCAEGNAFNAPADVSAVLSGLSPGETYHFRLQIETTSSGPFTGADQSFRTIPVPSEHSLIASFGEDGTSGSSFGGSGVAPAINQATRKLYGLEWKDKSGQLYGFDASAPPAFPPLGGFPINTIGSRKLAIPITVDNTGLGSTGNVYFATEDLTQVPFKHEFNGVSPSGAVLPGFPIDPGVNPGPPVAKEGAAIGSVAVNSTGEIWVAIQREEPHDRILKYNPAGVFQGSLDIPFPVGAPHRIAFDSDDNLYVALWVGSSSIWKFSAAGGYTSATKLPEPPGGIYSLAFDPSTEYLYANTSSGIVAIYDVASGELFDEFETGSGDGIAVDPANHTVYVGDNSKIHAYATGAPLLAPTATTAPASAITGSKATLNGFVDPEGLPVSECKFEYGKGTGYSQTAPCSSNPGSGSGDVAVLAEISGLTPNATYHYRVVAANASGTGKSEDETFTTNPPPVISSPAVEGLTYNSADLKALVNPKGFETTYRFEYGTTTAYGTKVPVPDGNAGSGKGDVAVSVHISGLAPDTLYHWRVVAENVNDITTTPDATFTSFGPVKAETMGSPIRMATTAQLQGRVDPDGAPTTYRFEYGTEGPCDANPCTATPDRPAGSGGVYRFVAEEVEGLEPDTTYHYRLTAESPTPGGPAIGGDMTVTTRASDAPLSHGDFSGPRGSDRAYEQVSLPDTGGNPVFRADAVSDDGNRAFYQVNGGTPLSVVGSVLTALYAERVETAPHQGGWRSTNIFPPRQELVGSVWIEPAGRPDLSDQVFQNVDTTNGAVAIWRLRPGQPAAKILQPAVADFQGPVAVSEDASRVLTALKGAHDPAHTPPNNEPNLYDVTSGAPRLVGLMPDDSVPSCGALIPGGGGSGAANVRRAPHWVSPDGSLIFFLSCNALYLRDLDTEETKLIGVNSSFEKSTPGAAFFLTSQSLAPDDIGGSDLYRYDLADETFDCVSCVVSGLSASVGGVAVAEDGSRAYFASSTELIRGAGTSGLYRVDVASGDFAYVAPAPDSMGEDSRAGNAITPDGSAFVFASSKAALNPLGGQQNGGLPQLYRYDDRDRSLTCLSCPQDGSAPDAAATTNLASATNELAGANRTSLSADGGIFAFATPAPLLDGDQNTARPGQKANVGTDIYEWRDGRLLLVTDGLTNWPDGGPAVNAVTPSGNDIFFTAATQYTQDALDGYKRLYDARIGGGFEFPPPPPPCPLEVCQGTPKGAPEEQAPGTGSFSGTGNVVTAPARRSCPKGRHKARKGGKARCVKSQGKPRNGRRAKHEGRAKR